MSGTPAALSSRPISSSGQTAPNTLETWFRMNSSVPSPSALLTSWHHALRLPERRVQHGRVDAVQRERPHDRVVLEAAHCDLHPRSCERMDGDVERVRGVLCKYDARRVVQAEQCRRLLAAVVYEVSCALRRPHSRPSRTRRRL